MRDNRKHPRVSCEGKGQLVHEGSVIEIELVNLSRDGACLSMVSNEWERFDDIPEVTGKVETQEEEIDFSGRICWSQNDGETTLFGIEFQAVNFVAVDRILTDLQIIEDPPMDAFNI